MFERLKKWIHRNDRDWLEEHGYIEKESQKEDKGIIYKSLIIEPRPDLVSVGRQLGMGAKYYKS